MFYGTEILRNTGLTNGAALMANIANGAISVLAAFFSIWLLGRMPRRKMLISAQITVIFVHFLLGICQMILPDGTPKGLLVLFLCVAFLAFQQVHPNLFSFFEFFLGFHFASHLASPCGNISSPNSWFGHFPHHIPSLARQFHCWNTFPNFG